MRRYSLRFLLVAMTLLAVVGGSWLHYIRPQKIAISAIVNRGGYVICESRGNRVVFSQSEPSTIWKSLVPMTPVQISLTGADVDDEFLGDHLERHRAGLKSLETVRLRNTAVTYEGLKHLSVLDSLECIICLRKRNSDSVLSELAKENYLTVEGMDLRSFCKWLDAATVSVSVAIDEQAIDAAGVDIDKVRVDCYQQDCTVGSAISESLAVHGLGWIVGDSGELVVTTTQLAGPYQNAVLELRELLTGNSDGLLLID